MLHDLWVTDRSAHRHVRRVGHDHVDRSGQHRHAPVQDAPDIVPMHHHRLPGSVLAQPLDGGVLGFHRMHDARTHLPRHRDRDRTGTGEHVDHHRHPAGVDHRSCLRDRRAGGELGLRTGREDTRADLQGDVPEVHDTGDVLQRFPRRPSFDKLGIGGGEPYVVEVLSRFFAGAGQAGRQLRPLDAEDVCGQYLGIMPRGWHTGGRQPLSGGPDLFTQRHHGPRQSCCTPQNTCGAAHERTARRTGRAGWGEGITRLKPNGPQTHRAGHSQRNPLPGDPFAPTCATSHHLRASHHRDEPSSDQLSRTTRPRTLRRRWRPRSSRWCPRRPRLG